MAQQHRQACLARWPGHHNMNTETRGKKRNSQVSSQRNEAEDHGGDTIGAATVVAGGHHPEAATARGGIVLTAERPSTSPRGHIGVAGYHPTNEAMKGLRKHREARAEAPARPAGADQAARARSTGGAQRRWR
jgi:hypothetical protein